MEGISTKRSYPESTKGWIWGNYELTEDNFVFKVDNQECFKIPYSEIANSNHPNKNEVALEFQQDDTKKDMYYFTLFNLIFRMKGDLLCEMRFFIPNLEEEKVSI